VFAVGAAETAQIDALGVLMAVGAETTTKFIFVTASATNDEMKIALASGAAAIVFKDTTAENLIACIRSVAAGRKWSHLETVETAVTEAFETNINGDLGYPLSRREFEVAKLVSRGLSNKEVGRLLTLSEGTIKIHLHKIYGKSGVPNRTALAALMSNRESAQ